MQLSEIMRPEKFDEVVGQSHILGKNGPLCKMLKTSRLSNMIFYGPCGTGKTTVARLVAKFSGRRFYSFNATSCSIKDIKAVFCETGNFFDENGVLIYVDEIQYFNKKQQQSLFPYIEDGRAILIASTTENLKIQIYGALLSRCLVFEFKSVVPSGVEVVIKRAIKKMELTSKCSISFGEEAIKFISVACGGDVRKAINFVEFCCILADGEFVDIDFVKKILPGFGNRYDLNGSEHYDLLSAFQKSIRGSDENAAIHYLARLLEAGDLLSPCRRLVVIACEDVGLAYPNAIAIVKACVDAAIFLGLPEAKYPLAQAVILLSTSPKSNSAYKAINSAMQDVESGKIGTIPPHLKNSDINFCCRSYIYPHDFKGHFVKQQYMPKILNEKVYYSFGDNKQEQLALKYRQKLLSLVEDDSKI